MASNVDLNAPQEERRKTSTCALLPRRRHQRLRRIRATVTVAAEAAKRGTAGAASGEAAEGPAKNGAATDAA